MLPVEISYKVTISRKSFAHGFAFHSSIAVLFHCICIWDIASAWFIGKERFKAFPALLPEMFWNNSEKKTWQFTAMTLGYVYSHIIFLFSLFKNVLLNLPWKIFFLKASKHFGFALTFAIFYMSIQWFHSWTLRKCHSRGSQIYSVTKDLSKW